MAKIENGAVVMVLSQAELAGEIQNAGAANGLLNVNFISMSMDYDYNNPSVAGWFEFKFSYQLANDPSIYYASMAKECTLDPVTQEFECTVDGGGSGKTICKAKNCGDRCLAKRTGCTYCGIPGPAPNPPVPRACEHETASAGSTLTDDLLKSTLGAVFARLVVNCC